MEDTRIWIVRVGDEEWTRFSEAHVAHDYANYLRKVCGKRRVNVRNLNCLSQEFLLPDAE